MEGEDEDEEDEDEDEEEGGITLKGRFFTRNFNLAVPTKFR